MTRTYELPLPKFTVGSKLDPKRLARAYARRCVLRELIADTLKVLRKLRAQGYADRTKDGGRILGNHNKNRIRTMMRIMDEAHTAEIVGVRPSRYGHVVGSFSHESYIESGQSHGGVIYDYQVLYRADIDGQTLAFAPTGAYHSEHVVEGALIDYPAAPADDLVLNPISAKDIDDGTWYLQIAPETEFVSYWYGTPEGYYNKPQYLRMNHAHLSTADFFHLPDRPVGDNAPVELDRAVLTGWQFGTKGHGGLGWHVARNAREAFEAAARWAARQDRQRREGEEAISDALARVILRKPWKETMDNLIREQIARKQAQKTETGGS